MRDIVITLIVFVGCIYTIKRPYIGVLLWSWLSYMNPHRLAYGFAYNMPYAQVTAIVLLLSLFFNKDKKSIPINILTITWILFLVLMVITTFFAFYPDQALIQFVKVLKIQLIVFLTIMLITDMEKLNQLIWVIVLSIGYFSVKGGVFTLLTGGGHRVWGPSGSFISDNNGLAIAVLMTIPFMIYLRKIVTNLWFKRGLLASAILSLFTVMGSQSRGALLAISAVGLFFWIKNDRKVVNLIVVFLLGGVLLGFMPDTWYQRMDTIKTYDEDASAMGRMNAWEYAYNAANDNILGMGFESWSDVTFAIYAPNPLDVHAAHSIYFTVLADHGWIGLFLFMLIFFLTWKRLGKLSRFFSNQQGKAELSLLARMMQVSLIAYLVGGAFLSLSYFDLPWHLVSFVVILERIYGVYSHKDLMARNKL